MTPTSLWRKDVISWSLYDFANTIYSMNIVSLYLKRYIVEDLGRDDRFFDIPYALSMLLAAVLLPAFGAMSDRAVKKKIFLLLFTTTCCLAVAGMAAVPLGAAAVVALAILLVVANFSYEAGQPFYNALLYSVADGRRARLVSGVGVALGYVGSIVGMMLVLPFVEGDLFGWNVPFLEGGGKAAAFLPTAILFMIFAFPVFIWVTESPVRKAGKAGLGAAYRDVWEGVRDTRKYPGVLRFLIADYFFEDAVATVIINIGIYCSLVVGLPEAQITLFLVVSTVSAVIGSFAIGWLAARLPLRSVLMAVVIGWVISLFIFVFVESRAVIWALGSVVGVLLGGLWTTTRPMLAEMVPRRELGRFFGLFSLSGRAAAVVGPLVWTAVVYAFHPGRPAGEWLGGLLGVSGPAALQLPYRLAIVSLALMMLVGLVIFRKVRPTQPGDNHA